MLSRDDNEKAPRCFQFAKVAHSKGHGVNVFMTDGGVLWANQKRDFTQKTGTVDSPDDYLPYLVENKVPIGVCTPCAKNRQVDESKFFSTMILDGSSHLVDLAVEAKVFNF